MTVGHGGLASDHGTLALRDATVADSSKATGWIGERAGLNGNDYIDVGGGRLHVYNRDMLRVS